MVWLGSAADCASSWIRSWSATTRTHIIVAGYVTLVCFVVMQEVKISCQLLCVWLISVEDTSLSAGVVPCAQPMILKFGVILQICCCALL